jgi:hypothetical protein
VPAEYAPEVLQSEYEAYSDKSCKSIPTPNCAEVGETKFGELMITHPVAPPFPRERKDDAVPYVQEGQLYLVVVDVTDSVTLHESDLSFHSLPLSVRPPKKGVYVGRNSL